MKITNAALLRTDKRKILLPKSCGGMLIIQKHLTDSLAIAQQLLRQEDRATVSVLEHAWRTVRKELQRGQRNAVFWLDDALIELSEAKQWVPSAFLKRLRQLQRGELFFTTTQGKRVVVGNYGLPGEFIRATECIGLNCRVVRKLGGGFEDLITGVDATEGVAVMMRAWQNRPQEEEHVWDFLQAAASEAGWRVAP